MENDFSGTPEEHQRLAMQLQEKFNCELSNLIGNVFGYCGIIIEGKGIGYPGRIIEGEVYKRTQTIGE